MAIALARGTSGWLLAVLLGLLAIASACIQEGTCADNDDCANGRCEPSGFCSIVDDECETGYRYGANAPAGQANFCVPSAGTTTGVEVPPVAAESDSERGDSETGDGGSTGSTGGPECPVVAVGSTVLYFGNGLYNNREVSPNIGDANLEDIFELFFRLESAGTFSLGETDWASYASCPQCVTVVRDGGVSFFASEGTITVAPGSDPLNGIFEATLSGLKLIEVEIDPETSATVVIEDGECLFVEDVTVVTETVDGWSCPSGYFEDGTFCDCGCGRFDPDCPNVAAESCDFCGVQGSCSASQPDCPGAVDPLNNATCDLALWTCDDEAFDRGDGICDCGCGFNDLDCVDATVESCTNCTGAGSCVEGDICVGQIHPFNNGTCTPFPGWTCNPAFYEADDGCDCGCGIPDPDCADATLMACNFCSNPGSCSDEDCPGTINPEMNSQCLQE